jgi:hypothetical protein
VWPLMSSLNRFRKLATIIPQDHEHKKAPEGTVQSKFSAVFLRAECAPAVPLFVLESRCGSGLKTEGKNQRQRKGLNDPELLL